MAVDLVVTDAGRAALVNAQNTGTAPVTITQVGLSATAVAATPAATALFGEFKRISGVPGEVVADDTIHINVTDDSADAYTVRSFGFYLADGTLFALYGQSSPIIEKASASIAALAFDTIFADIAAAELTFGSAEFTNPPATTERKGVIEIATQAESNAGTSSLLALTPATAKASVLAWLLAQDGSGSGLDADLLDGKDSAWFENIAARLGFTPVNKAGDAMGGFLSLHADPTAAMHAATRQWVLGQIATGALGFTPVNKAGDAMGGMLSLFANPTANLHAVTKQYADALLPAATILSRLLTVDGSGSGLDADLLDGKDSAWFENIIARLGYTPQKAEPGQLAIFATTRNRDGWLLCDHAAYSRTTYAGLFAEIGTTFGPGNGTTTFNVPMAGGEFLRFLDMGRGVDPDRALGSFQDALIGGHNHQWYRGTGSGGGRIDNTVNSGSAGSYNATGAESAMTGDELYGDHYTSGVRALTGGENRPRNIAFPLFIKT